MTSLHTRPIPRPDALRVHEHGWITESRHATSEGWIVYVRCVDCGARRVDSQSQSSHPLEAMTGVIVAR
ncbi:hypothetical protein M2317_000749 [Microbacterium sp. ZKA21]|uniref:hypothetical protein n=1 Tax=Microbacterium sp. ZKA21 TaxID=3381694 RepID=UPI003D25BCCC